MIAVTSATRIFVALNAVDLRKSFSGLQGLVQDQLRQDPLSGHLFLFTNKNRTRIKILCWDGSGLWVATKRLQGGRFSWPSGDGLNAVLRPEEFHALINGLEVVKIKHWFRM